jgi:hypothetical protein
MQKILLPLAKKLHNKKFVYICAEFFRGFGRACGLCRRLENRAGTRIFCNQCRMKMKNEKLKLYKFDVAEFLDSEEMISAYLAEVFVDGTNVEKRAALADVARARKMNRAAALQMK